MSSWDYYIGFETEPEGLDDFLNEQGYDLVYNQKGNKNYESREGGLVELFYFAEAPEVKKGEVPDWKRNRYKVASELMVSTKDLDAEEEAE
jgi:hypothetical protein